MKQLPPPADRSVHVVCLRCGATGHPTPEQKAKHEKGGSWYDPREPKWPQHCGEPMTWVLPEGD